MTEQRKHRYWSHDHKPSARARRQARRVRRDKEVNRLPEKFGQINWAVYTHRELWDMVKSADTGRMGGRAHDWQVLAGEVDRATGDVRELVQRLVVSWQGPSSVVAAESVSRLTEWAADASRRAYGVGTGLTAYTSAVEEAARRMPEPVHPDAEKWFREGYDVSTLDGPEGAYFLRQLLDDHRPSKEEQQAAKARAVDVMEAYERASREVHTGLPSFNEPAPAGAQVQADQVPPVRTPNIPDWDDPYTPGEHVPTDPDEPHTPAGGPRDTTSVAAVADSGSGPGGASGPGAGGGHGSGANFGPGAGVGARAGAGFGAGGGSGRAGGSGPLGPGGSSGVLGVAPGAMARGGVVGAAGGAGGFGMYPPVAPPNREEDREHRNRYDDGLDLLDDLPPAFPPVLGE
ncbi:PPE domain-containing protein [Saccharothrix variisporea]|uniref:PPE family protein n=1 Tax=Saccharothrix variisporea TaxID=543527 RepID=A0A495XII6_9PSEU|nr:PPE domain-containing protein [Saccharothrix variisporea]RKT73792.1 PPE family protein [Saccharothrix variisporea]